MYFDQVPSSPYGPNTSVGLTSVSLDLDENALPHPRSPKPTIMKRSIDGFMAVQIPQVNVGVVGRDKISPGRMLTRSPHPNSGKG